MEPIGIGAEDMTVGRYYIGDAVAGFQRPFDSAPLSDYSR